MHCCIFICTDEKSSNATSMTRIFRFWKAAEHLRRRIEVVGEAKWHLEINIDTNIPTGQSNCGGGLTWASWCKKPTKNHLKISAPRDCLWPVIRTENGKNSKYSKIGQYWMPPLEPLQATMSSNVGVNNNLRLGWRYSKKQETKFPTGSLGCGGQSW